MNEFKKKSNQKNYPYKTYLKVVKKNLYFKNILKDIK